jgi:hypothetical protein
LKEREKLEKQRKRRKGERFSWLHVLDQVQRIGPYSPVTDFEITIELPSSGQCCLFVGGTGLSSMGRVEDHSNNSSW